ncbi:unnamed protein product [Heligmosomoides polygyrus]|uniref:Uncharacterized protein n=1 Tax=Heligmosomoides polygyrus TaxID=6339 RepID=A0A183FH23_HELPZ|nr:unnamed protein product [Heligmosomoides polygyrus]
MGDELQHRPPDDLCLLPMPKQQPKQIVDRGPLRPTTTTPFGVVKTELEERAHSITFVFHNALVDKFSIKPAICSREATGGQLPARL